MLFNSVHFLIFFPIVVLIYFIVPRKLRYLWLLAASYYFYMCWNVKYIVLILSSTLVTWLAGRFVYACRRRPARRAALGICLVFHLGLLFFFKYFDFFLDIANRILGRIGWELLDRPFDVLLPVGISFYTFQALRKIFSDTPCSCPFSRSWWQAPLSAPAICCGSCAGQRR